MRITYFAVKKLDVGERTAEPGDLIPEVVAWNYLYAYINEGKIAPVRVSGLFEDEVEALEQWEKTGGRFTFYDDRNEAMAERNMRPTSSVGEKERIDGSDKAIEKDGLPKAELVDESSEGTPKLIEQMEESLVESGDVEEAEIVEVDKQYNEWTAADLKKEADNRKIAHGAGAAKADLVALLEQDDAEDKKKKQTKADAEKVEAEKAAAAKKA